MPGALEAGTGSEDTPPEPQEGVRPRDTWTLPEPKESNVVLSQSACLVGTPAPETPQRASPHVHGAWRVLTAPHPLSCHITTLGPPGQVPKGQGAWPRLRGQRAGGGF